MSEYKSVKVSQGRGGWGGPLVITPTADKPLIYSVTGGGIHPVAQRIAELTGGEAFDGFKSSAPFDKIAVAVIDCGGTVRSSTSCVLQVWVADDRDHRLETTKLLGILRSAAPVLKGTDLPIEVEYEDGRVSQFPVTAAEVTPIGEIAGQQYTVGPVTRLLREKYEKMVRA